MFADYISALILILFAEMGDKTQFLAMAFATKYPVKKILIGVFIGAFLNHGLAIVFGRAILRLVPSDIVGFAAGLMFIYFGFKSLTIDDEDVDTKENKYGPILTVSIAFFLGELGDKTQLAALGQSVNSSYMMMVLLGTVSGMILTSALGIFIGLKLGKSIPEDKLKISAFLIFIFFGFQKIYVSYLYQLNMILMLGLAVFVLSLMVYRIYTFNESYSHQIQSAFRKQAEALKKTRQAVEFKVHSMCKGIETCGICDESRCLIGYMKFTLENADHKITSEALDQIDQLKNKAFDKNQAKEIVEILENYYLSYPEEREMNKNLNTIYLLAKHLI